MKISTVSERPDSNTVQSYQGPGAQENQRQWQAARERIDQLKKDLGIAAGAKVPVAAQ